MEKENDQLKRDKDNGDLKIQTLEFSEQTLTQKITRKKDKVLKLNTAVKHGTQALIALQTDFDNNRSTNETKIATLESKVKEKAQEAQIKEEEIVFVKTKYKTKSSALKNFNSNLDQKLQSTENQLGSQLTSKENEIRALQSKLETEKTTVTDLESKLTDANDTNTDLNSQLNDVSSKLKSSM